MHKDLCSATKEVLYDVQVSVHGQNRDWRGAYTALRAQPSAAAGLHACREFDILARSGFSEEHSTYIRHCKGLWESGHKFWPVKALVCAYCIHSCALSAPLSCPVLCTPGDTLEATCHFNSLERETVTSAGSTHHDEMCNLYMMMWSELPVFLTCSGGGTWNDAPYINMHGPGECPHC